MDLRQTTVSEVVEEQDRSNGAAESPSEPPRRYLRFDSAEPEPDVKAMLDESALRHRILNERLGVGQLGSLQFSADGSGFP